MSSLSKSIIKINKWKTMLLQIPCLHYSTVTPGPQDILSVPTIYNCYYCTVLNLLLYSLKGKEKQNKLEAAPDEMVNNYLYMLFQMFNFNYSEYLVSAQKKIQVIFACVSDRATVHKS